MKILNTTLTIEQKVDAQNVVSDGIEIKEISEKFLTDLFTNNEAIFRDGLTWGFSDTEVRWQVQEALCRFLLNEDPIIYNSENETEYDGQIKRLQEKYTEFYGDLGEVMEDSAEDDWKPNEKGQYTLSFYVDNPTKEEFTVDIDEATKDKLVRISKEQGKDISEVIMEVITTKLQ